MFISLTKSTSSASVTGCEGAAYAVLWLHLKPPDYTSHPAQPSDGKVSPQITIEDDRFKRINQEVKSYCLLQENRNEICQKRDGQYELYPYRNRPSTHQQAPKKFPRPLHLTRKQIGQTARERSYFYVPSPCTSAGWVDSLRVRPSSAYCHTCKAKLRAHFSIAYPDIEESYVRSFWGSAATIPSRDKPVPILYESTFLSASIAEGLARLRRNRDGNATSGQLPLDKNQDVLDAPEVEFHVSTLGLRRSSVKERS
ncbi:hypothetical protein C8R45DRAFT_944277 [Mycena sanguinolenta]|nr:hypothetical protein C8R45DRAFT_944277 [Mycena sanguinolenta]